ncbi:MAG: diguanylate cyclase [Thermoleophilaceae bacterium]
MATTESSKPPGQQGSWLCADDFARRRLIDMERHVKPARSGVFALLAISLMVLSPWVGWWPLGPLAGAVIVFLLADQMMVRSERPEYWIAGAWAFCQLMIGAAVVIQGGAGSSFFPWLAIPVATLSARFTARGIVAGVAWTAAIAVGVAFSRHPHAVIDNPQILVVPLSVVVGIAVLTTALMRSDVLHRAEAALDPLTGLFNRHALHRRAVELVEQAHLTDAPIAVLVGDLDHFKKVNDEHGHLVGDNVLRDVAYILRTALRSFDLVYRYGGEEFVVLLPGASQGDAVVIAERMRAAVAEAHPGGLDISISFGVCAARGLALDFERLFHSADELLYRAKLEGRNRVVAGAPAFA